MDNFVENKRILVRRSTTPGVVPVPPSSGVTNPYSPDSTWDSNMVLDGELFANIKDGKIWFKAESDIPILLGNVSGATYFTDLVDTPSSLLPGADMFLKVDTTGSFIEFVSLADITGGTYNNYFTSLQDTPISYAGYSGYTVVVNSTEDGLTFSNVTNSLIGLNDVNITGYTDNYILAGNGSEIVLKSFDDIYVNLTTDQSINGEKTFNELVTLSGSTRVHYPFVLVGASSTKTINDIVTSITSSSTDVQLPTAKACYTLNRWKNGNWYDDGVGTIYNTIVPKDSEIVRLTNFIMGASGTHLIDGTVTSISSSSTDSKIPSAKAVYTLSKWKDGTIYVDGIGTLYPTIVPKSTTDIVRMAGLIFGSSGTHLIDGTVTTVNASSTDSKIPTAKACYTAIQTGINGLASETYVDSQITGVTSTLKYWTVETKTLSSGSWTTDGSYYKQTITDTDFGGSDIIELHPDDDRVNYTYFLQHQLLLTDLTGNVVTIQSIDQPSTNISVQIKYYK